MSVMVGCGILTAGEWVPEKKRLQCLTKNVKKTKTMKKHSTFPVGVTAVPIVKPHNFSVGADSGRADDGKVTVYILKRPFLMRMFSCTGTHLKYVDWKIFIYSGVFRLIIRDRVVR
jgi:hypothetical protein